MVFCHFLVYTGISLIYTLGPSMHRRIPFINVGALIATILSLITSLGFSYFINNFGRYNEIYGSIGALIVIMVWIQFNSFILLVGFELNASISVHTLKKRKEFSAQKANFLRSYSKWWHGIVTHQILWAFILFLEHKILFQRFYHILTVQSCWDDTSCIAGSFTCRVQTLDLMMTICGLISWYSDGCWCPAFHTDDVGLVWYISFHLFINIDQSLTKSSVYKIRQ